MRFDLEQPNSAR